MAFILSVKDAYRQAVEAATDGKNTVMYDDKGNPSIMVCIPKFNLSDVIDGAPNAPHPAFIVNGVVKNEIWVSKFQNIVQDGRAYSLPGQDPKNYVNYDTAKGYCTSKGKGWHMLTNAEWAALALWSKKNNTMPRGNNNYGSDITASYERGRESYFDAGAGKTGRVLTGSGPASWSHDGTHAGVFDLNGNVNEWVDGMKLLDGKIYVHQDNNFETLESPGKADGWVDTNTFYDNSTPGDATQTDHGVGGAPILSDVRSNPQYTGDASANPYYGSSSTKFETLGNKNGFTTPDLLKYLALAPIDANHGGDYLYVRNYGERLPYRGGYWGDGANAGAFSLGLSGARTLANTSLGFRSAYVSL